MRRLSTFTEDVKAEQILELYVFRISKILPIELKQGRNSPTGTVKNVRDSCIKSAFFIKNLKFSKKTATFRTL